MARPKKEKPVFVPPTNPKDIQAIRDAIYEIEGHLSFIDDRKSLIKSIEDDLEEKYQMSKKLIKDMVKAHQKDKYDEMVSENSDFEVSYEKIMSLTPTMESEDED